MRDMAGKWLRDTLVLSNSLLELGLAHADLVRPLWDQSACVLVPLLEDLQRFVFRLLTARDSVVDNVTRAAASQALALFAATVGRLVRSDPNHRTAKRLVKGATRLLACSERSLKRHM